MGELFIGCRRKMGVVTLVIGCVLMAGWARSYTWQDRWTQGGASVRSIRGIVYIDYLDRDGHLLLSAVIPYWPIVIPLVFLLSAYLLLVKPRVAKSKKTIEPASAEAP